MKSQEYWLEREKKHIEQLKKKDIQTSKEIQKRLELAYKEIEKDILADFSRYASGQKITLADAMKRADMFQVKLFAKQAEEMVKNKDFSKYANTSLKLYNLTMRVNRLELLKAQIGLDLINNFDTLEKDLNEKFADEAIKRYEMQSGILGEFTSKDIEWSKNKIDKIVNGSFYVDDFPTFSDQIWKYQAELKSSIDNLLVRAFTQGENPRVWARELRKQFDVTKYQAERLARTESARIQIEIQKDSYEQAEIEEFEFVAEPSACGLCRPLDGKTFKVSKMQSGLNASPMHPNCIVPDTKIIAPDIEAMTRSNYSGDVIEAILSDGTRLTVTPNHIVLTTRGWVRAKFLTQADNVISYGGWDESTVKTGAYPTDNDSVPTAEQLFASLVKTNGGSSASMPSTTVDFKGDVIPNSKVDIVFVDGELRNKLDPFFSQCVSDVILVDTFKNIERILPSNRTLAEFLVCTGIAADGIMSGLSVAGVFLASSFSHHELVSMRVVSNYDTRLQETISDNRPADTKFFSDRVFANSRSIQRDNCRDVNAGLDGAEGNAFFSEDITNFSLGDSVNIGNFLRNFAGLIKINNVVNVATRYYSGHVYDASSMSTLYTANGVITSNCRCSTVPSI